MLARGKGAIVNMGSQAGAVALPGEGRLLPEQGGGVAHDALLCGRVGQEQRSRQLRRPTFIATDGTEAMLARPDFHAEVIERIAALTASANRVKSPMPWCSLPRMQRR